MVWYCTTQHLTVTRVMAEASATEHDQLISEYVTVWNEGNYAKLPDVVTEDVALYDPGAPEGEIHGRDALEGFLQELRRGFPDLHVTINEMVATEAGVMAEWTATGTHKGEFNGIPPTQREVEFQGMDNIMITDGKVKEHRVYYDSREMQTQLGLTFPEALGVLPRLAWRKLQASL